MMAWGEIRRANTMSLGLFLQELFVDFDLGQRARHALRNRLLRVPHAG